MNKELREIQTAFNGKLVGSQSMKIYVCQVLMRMPKSIVRYITKNCWFLSSMVDAWAFTFTGNDLRNQHMIFLSDDLLNQPKIQVYYSIAHEIGHVVLRHRNSVFEKQSNEEIKRQEKEADEFARQYINVE